MRRPFRILLTLGFGLLAGCMRPPGVNPSLQPVEAPDRWLKGRAYLKQEQAGVEVQAAFVEAGPGSLQFDLVVANRGTTTVLVDPERCFCDLTLPADTLAPREIPAVDPEARIRAIIQASAAEKASQSDTTAFRGLFLLADLGDTLSQSTQRNPRQQREAQRGKQDTYRDMDQADRRSGERLTGLAEQRRHWEEDCLRKTTLEPGYGLRGRVVFHTKTQLASQVVLRVPVGAGTFRFAFRPL
ncbi:hypothetical protein [Geothrix terrae]|uniref:hypothetical protein n=1 Tax=Geothrix terrae TaxID=2922720 RepID=UPI001FAD85BF|nr:hypothetical protein [Geothrix terrae]